MGNKKMLAVVVLVLAALCHGSAADAATLAVINVSSVPVNVSARVNVSDNPTSVVVAAGANASQY